MTGSVLSKRLSTALAYLQLQIGTNVCPFDLEYDLWSFAAPLSWVKMLWRTLHSSGFELHLEYHVIPIPRVRDRVLMEFFMEHEKDVNVLKSLSRVRGWLNALFLSDIVTTDGKFIEKFAVERGEHIKRSKFEFLEEQPTTDDW